MIVSICRRMPSITPATSEQAPRLKVGMAWGVEEDLEVTLRMTQW